MSIPYEQGEKDFAASFPPRFRLDVIAVRLNAKFGNFRSKQSVAAMRTMMKDKIKKNFKVKKAEDNKNPDQEIASYIFIPKGRPVIKTLCLLHAMTSADINVYDIARAADLPPESIRALINKGGIPAPYAGKIAGILGIGV